MSRHCPPSNAYAVSHQMQRNGQPVRRTNTVGQPTASASPWMEWKISLTRNRRAAAAAGAGAIAFMESAAVLLQRDRSQPALRETGYRGARVLLDHGLER